MIIMTALVVVILTCMLIAFMCSIVDWVEPAYACTGIAVVCIVASWSFL